MINRTIIVERDSRDLTARVIGALDQLDAVPAAAAAADASAVEAAASAAAAEAAADDVAAAIGNIPPRYSRVSDMQAATGLVIGEIVETLGYHDPADGGANEYEIVAAGTGAIDGGRYIEISETGYLAQGLFPRGYRPEQWGARGDNVTDDRAAIQAGLDYLSSVGFGVLTLASKSYRINSATSFDCVRSTSVSEGTLVAATVNSGLLVRAGVYIAGRGSSASEINVTYTGTLANGIGCVEYANASLSGFRLTGPGAAGNGGGATPHGIELSLVQDATHINERVVFDDIHITDWASYGIGHQYGHARDCAYRNLIIEDVGADGIDHKVRFGPLDPNWDGCKGVSFENIIVRRHGQRITGVSGLDIRGVCSVDQVRVLEVPTDCFGISLSAAIAQGDDEIRTPSARSTLTNFFIEAADPDDTVVGLHLFSGGPASVGDGYIHWCKTGVWVKGQTLSPSGWRDAQNISNVIVEGSRDGVSFLVDNPRAYLSNCRSIADVQYFDEQRGFVMDGGTTYPIKGGYSGGSIFVFLNDVAQVSGVDFTISGGNLIFTSPLSPGDEVVFAFRTGIALDVNAQHCSIVGGGCDEFHNVSVSLADAGVVGTTAITGFRDGTGAALLTRTVSGALVHQPAGAATNIPFEFRGKGAGGIRIPFLPTSSAGLPSGQVWNDAGTLKII